MTRIAAAMFAALLAVAVAADSGRRPGERVALPVIRIEKGEACVAPVEEMRRNHMQMLLHQRERTMREGVRKHGPVRAGLYSMLKDRQR